MNRAEQRRLIKAIQHDIDKLRYEIEIRQERQAALLERKTNAAMAEVDEDVI